MEVGQLTKELFKGTEVRVYGEVDKPLFVAADIAKILEIKNIRETMSGLESYEKSTVFITDRVGRKQVMSALTESGLRRVLCTSRKPIAAEIANKMGAALYSRYESKESETLRCIIRAFANHEYELQKQVQKYRIDLYFVQYNIAIECDEHNHTDRCEVYEKVREEEIINEIGCKFIRYNPDEKNFSIFDVIAKIHNCILNRAVQETMVASQTKPECEPKFEV